MLRVPVNASSISIGQVIDSFHFVLPENVDRILWHVRPST